MTPAQTQKQLLDDAGKYLAGGGTGLFVLPAERNLIVARGEGSRVWDVAGREYIDYHLSSGPALLGHAHPAITAAVSGQLPKGTTFFFLNEPEIELARRLVEAIPCGEVVHYTGSGTEATFYALRIARAFTGRNKVLKFEGAWHGMHDYGLWGTVPSQPSQYPHAAPDSVGVPDETGKTVLVTPFNETERAVAMIEKNAGDLAAVIVEPLQRVLLPEPGFLQAIRDVTRKHGIVLIFDEIVTGFRIAWGGAQEKFGVIPDVACYGKSISGGFPLAAIVGNADIMSVLDARSRPKAEVVWATNTLNGNPVCAAAGLAAIEALSQPGVYAHFQRIGSRLRKGMVEPRLALGHRTDEARPAGQSQREVLHLHRPHRQRRGRDAEHRRRRLRRIALKAHRPHPLSQRNAVRLAAAASARGGARATGGCARRTGQHRRA